MNDSKLKEELDQVYTLLSSFRVSGDAVDVMAEVREHLRAAYRLADAPEEAGHGG